MGERDAARVDIATVLDVARRYEAIADVLDGVTRTRLSPPSFGAADAGRAHAAHGDSLRRAIVDVVDQLRTWSRASNEIAAALRASADHYVDADVRGAGRLA